MALIDDLTALLTLQAVDVKIDRANAAIDALNTGASVVATYNKTKAEAVRLRAIAVHAQAEQKDAELRLQTIEEKAKQVNKTLYGGTVQATRELENLQKELEMLTRHKGEAEEKVLVAMETASAAVSEADATDATMEELAKEYRVIRNVYKERHGVLSAEVAKYQKERAKAVKPIPPAILTRYDLIRSKRNGLGAATLMEDGSCGACHTRVSSVLSAEAFTLTAVHTCEHCGRILVPQKVIK